MPKPKSALALFEVYRRAREQLAAADAIEQPTAAAAAEPSEPARVDEPPAGEPPPPRIKTRGDRIELSLSTLSLAVMLFVVGLLLVGAFAVGKNIGYESGLRRARGEAELLSDDEFAELRDQPAQPEVLQDLGSVEQRVVADAARERRETRPTQAGFVDNLNYVWIETFSAQEDAARAQTYLRGRQVESVPIQRNGKWILVSTEGFDYQIPEEKKASLDLLEQIKQIGREYFQAGGRYRFDGYVSKKRPGDNW